MQSSAIARELFHKFFTVFHKLWKIMVRPFVRFPFPNELFEKWLLQENVRSSVFCLQTGMSKNHKKIQLSTIYYPTRPLPFDNPKIFQNICG